MGKLNNLSNHEIKSSILKLAPRLRIDFALDRKIRNYSKGMLQRLGFVCSLIHNPDLIILDEPVSGLDPIGRKEIKDVISEINKEGKTIFFSSHIVPDVEEICDTVIFLEKGKLIYQGAIEKLIHDNQKSTYELKYFNKNTNQLEILQVNSSNKESCISDQIKLGNDIISFNRDKLSLEEIFYKVKNHERKISHD
jgi:ABC-2 type transport system ATP-binding protein